MTRILILTGDAGESQEIYYAKFRLEEEGWQVHITAPGSPGDVFLSVVHDFEPGHDTYTEKPGYRVTIDVGLDEVDPASYEGLVLPGGRAPEFLCRRPQAVSVVKAFAVAGKPIAANCHGPLLLAAAGVTQGRTLTCYPDLEFLMSQAGARFVDQAVVVDGNLVSVRGWPDNSPWMGEFVKLLKARKS